MILRLQKEILQHSPFACILSLSAISSHQVSCQELACYSHPRWIADCQLSVIRTLEGTIFIYKERR